MGFLDESKSKKEKKMTSADIAKKYSVIFSFSQNSQLKINLVSNKKDSSRFFIKNDLDFFSFSQKKVLKDVRESDGWGNSIDIHNFFLNLEKSGFDIYFKEDKEIEKVYFGEKDIEKKDKISISFFQAKKTDFFPLSENDFIFRVENESEFVNLRKKVLFFGDYFICIKNNKILLFNSSKDLNDILKRIINKNYEKLSGFFSEKFETKLSEGQIFNINEIIKKAGEVFDLKNKIESNFLIKKFDKKEEEILVDFDIKNKKLEIKVFLDYGFRKINVSKTVFSKITSGKKSFSRITNPFYGYKYIFDISGKNISYAQVDHEREIDVFKNILSFHQELGFNKNLTLNKKGIKQINYFLENNWENFNKLGYKISYVKNKIDKKLLDFKADLDVRFSGGSDDLLSFDAELYLGEYKISLSQLKLYASGKQDYVLGTDGEVIEVKNKEELERFISMISIFHQNEKTGKFEGKLYSGIDLENIFTSSQYYNVKFNEGFRKFISEAKSNKPIEDIKIDKEYSGILRDYQKEGLDWMHFLKKYHFGGLLADDMGLGKTIQTLIMLEINSIKDKPSIVIVPKTLIGNWVEESRKFAKKTKVLVVDGSQKQREELIKTIKEFDLVITSYSSYQRDADKYKKESVFFNYAVLDEAQYIKNFKTKNAQVVKEINADFRLALTGTPLENSISEIWSIFEFLMPGFLGKQSSFTKNFVIPVVKKGQLKKLKDLRKKISIFMLRRTKEFVLKELPDKTSQNLLVSLSEDQSLLYQEVLSSIKSDLFKNESVGDISKSYMNILAALTKLRQICNHPNLILKDKDYKKYNSSKLNLFLDLVSEIKSEGRKVLVFSQFKTMLEILEKELKEKKIKYSILTGETKDRKELIDEFNSSEDISVFLISLKAGGVGVNLTSADNVILFDPWWNPSVERQAIDRTHRIGQKKKVNVYKIISKGTVEEKILELQDKKQSLFDSLVNDSGDSFKKLSWEDIKNLFE